MARQLAARQMWALAETPPNCSNRYCMRESELEADGTPYCIACADLILERWLLICAHPELRDTLAPLFEGTA